jgi:hypothetical protein
MAELSSMEGAMGSLPERREGGRGRGRGGMAGAHLGGAMGRGGLQEGGSDRGVLRSPTFYTWGRTEREEEEEEEREKKNKRKKRKDMENFPNLKIFGEKNKR